MPARFKGLSEYRRNFKWRKADLSKLCSPMHEQKCRWAGLPSDQLGIAKEPNFISKRRVPYYNTQISKSFEWNRDNDCETDKSSECGIPPPVELHTNHSKDDINQESIKTPDAPRLPEKMHPSPAGSRLEPTVGLSENKKKLSKTPVHENGTLASTGKDLGKTDNGLKRVLQRKAGMNIVRSSSFPRSSEYQRQFVWKTPEKVSPVLTADQVIHSANKSIPPHKSPAFIPETEYERCFKASPAVKQLRETCNLEEKEHPVESSPGEKKEKKVSLSKISEDPPKESKSETEQKQHRQKHKPHFLHRSFRKVNTEYRSKFLSPAQYMYKDGAWLRIRRNVPGQGSRNTLNYMWYMEVQELREKAEAYRQRIQGTHFSRDHLNQLLSDNNRLWDLSSESSAEEAISNNVRALDLAGVSEKQISPGPKVLLQPELSEQLTKNNTEKLGISDAATVPVKRRLVWGEPGSAEKLGDLPLEEGEEKANKQDSEEFEKGSDKDSSTNNQPGVNVSLVKPSEERSDCSSASSRKGGRISTPQLRLLGGAQRSHHDLTTPAVGGAVLVSPPKVKPLSSVQIKKGSSENQVSREDTKRKSSRDEVEAILPPTSSAAGLQTQDPLPLRRDQWPGLDLSGVRTSPSTVQSECTPIVPALKPAKDSASSSWSPSWRIQGTLRDPEFQHNGNVASPKKSWLQLPLQERNYNDEDDDRLSQLSARSAASSSLASQVLERAQRRKENFWGKM